MSEGNTPSQGLMSAILGLATQGNCKVRRKPRVTGKAAGKAQAPLGFWSPSGFITWYPFTWQALS